MNKLIIKKLFDLNCFKFGSFQLKNNQISPFYINLRILISDPNILSLLAEMVYQELIKPIHLKCLENGEVLSICGLPYAGIPLATFISCKYNIPLLLLRKEKKKYGTKQMIEGITDKTQKVILIDDIITSGTSINESLEFFNQFEILDIITVIDREQSKKIENYNSLFTISEVFHFLKLSNLISKEQYDLSLEFVKNN